MTTKCREAKVHPDKVRNINIINPRVKSDAFANNSERGLSVPTPAVLNLHKAGRYVRPGRHAQIGSHLFLLCPRTVSADGGGKYSKRYKISKV